MFYDTANTSPSMRLTKTQQVTTSFFPTPAEQNTTGKQQQLFTSALCEHQEDFARETREGKRKKKEKQRHPGNNTLRYVQACSLHSNWVHPLKEMRTLCLPYKQAQLRDEDGWRPSAGLSVPVYATVRPMVLRYRAVCFAKHFLPTGHRESAAAQLCLHRTSHPRNI